MIWSNESTVKWREEPPGQMRVGGLNSTYTSTLSARVSGKGKFVFTYRFNSWTWQNTFDFSINGSSQFKKSYNGSTTFSETVTKEITADGETTFAWTYAVADNTRDYGPGYASQAGVWLSNVQWIPESASVFPSVGDLATAFGQDSEVTKNVTTAAELAKVNAFAKSVGLTSVASLTTAQKAHFYESYVLSAVMKTPALLTAEPKLEIASFGVNASNAANWNLTVSLSAGNQNLEMIAAELGKMVRVGTDVWNVNGAATVLATPSGDGSTVTLTIQKPGTTAGFVRVVVDK